MRFKISWVIKLTLREELWEIEMAKEKMSTNIVKDVRVTWTTVTFRAGGEKKSPAFAAFLFKIRSAYCLILGLFTLN